MFINVTISFIEKSVREKLSITIKMVQELPLLILKHEYLYAWIYKSRSINSLDTAIVNFISVLPSNKWM